MTTHTVYILSARHFLQTICYNSHNADSSKRSIQKRTCFRNIYFYWNSYFYWNVSLLYKMIWNNVLCFFLYYLCLCHKIGLYNVMGFSILPHLFIALDLMTVNDCIVCHFSKRISALIVFCLTDEHLFITRLCYDNLKCIHK